MWFLQKWITRGNMEPFEPKSHLDNQQQHPDSRLQSDPIIENDKLAQVLAQDMENLVLSCKSEVLDRCIQGHSVVLDEEDQVKQAVDEDLRHLVVKEDVNEVLRVESSSGSEEEKHRDVRQFVDEAEELHGLKVALEVDPKELRVLEERETGETEIGCENQEEEDDDDEKVYEHRDSDLKEKHEIEIEDEDSGSEIGDYENNVVEELENESKIVGEDGWKEGSVTVLNDDKSKAYHYPLRLDAEDCSYYIRTGVCKFGSNCWFNHPLRRKNQSAKETKKQKEENMEMHGQKERKQPTKPTKETKKQKEENVEKHGQTERKPIKETKKQKEENTERHGQTECKFHTSSAGCKHGKTCKFNHGIRKSVKTPVSEYNFLGLPIRPEEKECPYYMRHGSCKYGPSCRFNHPDPTAVGGGDSPTTVSLPLQPAPQPNITNMPSWSTPRPPVMYPPTQNMGPLNPDWNVYQAPAPTHSYPGSERGLPIPPAFFFNNLPSNNNTNMYTHHHQQPMLVSEYPERPAQPDCGYFIKTGVCKYRTSCKYNHPQNRITRTSRDQNICTYFSRHGTCKYGSACKYDHPVNYNYNSNSGEGYDGSNGPGPGPVIQQSAA